MPGWSIDFLTSAAPEVSSSGASRGVWELARRLRAHGHAVRVLFPAADSPEATAEYFGVQRVEIPLVGVSGRPFGREVAIGKNASALLDPKADLVMGTDESAGALQVPSRGSPPHPAYGYLAHHIALHTYDATRPREPPPGFRQRLGKALERRALSRLEGAAITRARTVVVATEPGRALLHRYYRYPDERIVLIPDGVPDPLDVGTREECRSALRVPHDVPVASFIGHAPERQGLPAALDAFRRVRSLFPGSRFLVVGSTPPSEPGVMSLGAAEERTKAQVLRASDVFLFPALDDGFHVGPREAMRYGVATVVSRHVALEGIDLASSVRQVVADDPQEFARELAELFADPALRRSMGEAGRLWADGFSYDRMAERFETTFRATLAAVR